MDIRRHLEGLSPDEIVEVSYLVGRYLTHAIDDVIFTRMFHADAPSNIGPDSFEEALDVVRAIEDSEHRPLKDFSHALRHRYMRDLTDAVKELVRPVIGPDMIDDIRSELAALHS